MYSTNNVNLSQTGPIPNIMSYSNDIANSNDLISNQNVINNTYSKNMYNTDGSITNNNNNFNFAPDFATNFDSDFAPNFDSDFAPNFDSDFAPSFDYDFAPDFIPNNISYSNDIENPNNLKNNINISINTYSKIKYNTDGSITINNNNISIPAPAPYLSSSKLRSTYTSPISSYTSPLSTYTSPISSYTSPISSYTSPISSYTSPLSTYASKSDDLAVMYTSTNGIISANIYMNNTGLPFSASIMSTYGGTNSMIINSGNNLIFATICNGIYIYTNPTGSATSNYTLTSTDGTIVINKTLPAPTPYGSAALNTMIF
jgi:hypothetical protein